MLWDFGDGSPKEPQTLTVDEDSPPVTHHYTSVGTYKVTLTSKDGKKIAERGVTVTGPGRAETSASSFAERDRVVRLVAAFLAVSSGMLALYLVDAAWGVPEDYVKAALWGGTVTEGLAAVGALVGRTWPAKG